LGDCRWAVGLYDRCIVIRERLVASGRSELRGYLAWAQVDRAGLLLDSPQRQQAISEARRAIGVLRQEVARTGRGDLEDALKWAEETFAGIV